MEQQQNQSHQKQHVVEQTAPGKKNEHIEDIFIFKVT
jgi:hypothetical protein